MTHVPGYDWISVHEAARRHGCSVSTIRRMIEAGTLVGEREPLGGSRERYRVRMPQETRHEAPASESPDAPPDAPETPHEAPALSERLLETVLTQADTIADLRERVGRAEAERDTLRTAHAECSNLSHAEASRFVQEATEQRFRADALAAQLVEARATLDRERAERGRRFGWWPWRT